MASLAAAMRPLAQPACGKYAQEWLAPFVYQPRPGRWRARRRAQRSPFRLVNGPVQLLGAALQHGPRVAEKHPQPRLYFLAVLGSAAPHRRATGAGAARPRGGSGAARAARSRRIHEPATAGSRRGRKTLLQPSPPSLEAVQRVGLSLRVRRHLGVRPVAERFRRALLARAEVLLLRRGGRPRQRLEARPRVAAVAHRLLLRLAAGAPVVGLAGFHVHGNGAALGAHNLRSRY